MSKEIKEEKIESDMEPIGDKETQSFLDVLNEKDGSKYHIKLPDNEDVSLVLSNWRWVENENFDSKALMFDVLSYDGKPTEQYQDNKGNYLFPDLTTTSKRLIKELSPILREAIEQNKGQIAVKVKKFTGKDPFDTKYSAEKLEMM